MRHCDSNVARWLARALTAAVLVLGTVAGASAQVVISQVYGAGGNAGAVLQPRLRRMFNRGAAA